MEKTRPGRIDSLQTVRCFAFIAIFISHAIKVSLPLGTWGVSIFMVLSGFLMMYSYNNRDCSLAPGKAFLFSVGKIKKLYLLHIISMALVLVYRYIMLRTTAVITDNKWNLVYDTLLVQSWNPDSKVYFSVNSVAWYLSVCLFLYFAFPYVRKGIKAIASKGGVLALAAVIFAVMAAAGYGLSLLPVSKEISDNWVKWVTYICPLYRLGDFAIGCCFGYIFTQRTRTVSTAAATVLECVSIAAAVGAMLLYSENMSIGGVPWLRANLLFVPSSLAVVYSFALGSGLVSRLLTNRVTLYIGNASAYAFLLHNILIKYSNLLLGKQLSAKYPLLSCAAAFALTIAVTAVYMSVSKLIARRKKVSA